MGAALLCHNRESLTTELKQVPGRRVVFKPPNVHNPGRHPPQLRHWRLGCPLRCLAVMHHLFWSWPSNPGKGGEVRSQTADLPYMSKHRVNITKCLPMFINRDHLPNPISFLPSLTCSSHQEYPRFCLPACPALPSPTVMTW